MDIMNKIARKYNYILPILLILVLSSALMFYKLNYESFFTDEILYTDAGQEYYRGDYTMNLQHPLISKYIAGIVMQFTQTDVFLLRLPFAILGVLSALIVYLIIKEYYEKEYAFLGAMIFSVMPFIYSSTRMVMMEAPMHFFWLLFNLFFIKYLNTSKFKFVVLAGIVIGLGMATKFPTIILYPFSITAFAVFKKISKKALTKNEFIHFVSMFGISLGTYGLTYIDLFIKSGIDGLIRVVRVTKDVFISRNEEGKAQVVGDAVYNKSPWWYYGYFMVNKYPVLQLVITPISLLAAMFEKSFYSLYWLVFGIYTFVFFQLIPLKNDRYISTIEIALVFLSVSGLRYIVRKFTNVKVKQLLILALITLVFIFLPRLQNITQQTPTKYYALYNYLVEKTNNFTNGDRTYIMGSIRSSRWQFDHVAPDLVVSRKDFDIMFPEFPNFKYIVFDDNELLKNQNNELYRYIKYNKDQYTVEQVPGLTIYILKVGATPLLLK